jgi:hypothetical protein
MKSCGKVVLLVALVLANVAFLPGMAFACATCGCSELCPLTCIMDSEKKSGGGKGLLTESIWGNVILKMAYQRDPQIQKLVGRRRISNAFSSAGVSGAIGGTLGQNIISMATLNPPAGQSDSYLPGSLGLGLSGLVNVVFDGSNLINWHLGKKIRARQLAVKGRVESILEHLEHSEAACPNAQRDLSEIIGERAASDCIKLWQSSHTTTASAEGRTISDGSSQSTVSGIKSE